MSKRLSLGQQKNQIQFGQYSVEQVWFTWCVPCKVIRQQASLVIKTLLTPDLCKIVTRLKVSEAGDFYGIIRLELWSEILQHVNRAQAVWLQKVIKWATAAHLFLFISFSLSVALFGILHYYVLIISHKMVNWLSRLIPILACLSGAIALMKGCLQRKGWN